MEVDVRVDVCEFVRVRHVVCKRGDAAGQSVEGRKRLPEACVELGDVRSFPLDGCLLCVIRHCWVSACQEQAQQEKLR